MPAIRGIHSAHPVTGEAGIWIEPNWRDDGTVVGISQTTIDAFVAGLSGTAAQKRTALKNRLELLQGAIDGTRDGNGVLVTAGQMKVIASVVSLSPSMFDFQCGDGVVLGAGV